MVEGMAVGLPLANEQGTPLVLIGAFGVNQPLLNNNLAW